MKNIIKMIAVILLISTPIRVQAAEKPAIHGAYGVAIDARTGEILYDKEAKEKGYPASITKILTAMLLEEHVKDGEMMTASEHAVGQEASNAYFKLTVGEKISKEDAMYALMLISSNDVAMTIAEHISGTQEKFAVLMNEKAKEIGAKDTHFTSPNGLHDPNHVTTAYDMALITKEALHYPFVMEVMGTKEKTIQTSERTVDITNPSKIHDNPLALGGKTGYTNAAQNTLVEILEKDGKKVIAVVMKTTLAEEYNDIAIMGEYAFEHMPTYELYVKKGETLQTKTVAGVPLHYVAKEDVYVPVDKGKKKTITKEIITYDLPKGTIQKGDVIGKVVVKQQKSTVQEVELTADKKVVMTKKSEPRAENDTFSIVNMLISIFLPIAFYAGFVLFYNVKQQKRQKAKRS